MKYLRTAERAEKDYAFVSEPDEKTRGYDFSYASLPQDPGGYSTHNRGLTTPAKTDRVSTLKAAWGSFRTWPLVDKSEAPLGEDEVSENRAGCSASVLLARH